MGEKRYVKIIGDGRAYEVLHEGSDYYFVKRYDKDDTFSNVFAIRKSNTNPWHEPVKVGDLVRWKSGDLHRRVVAIVEISSCPVAVTTRSMEAPGYDAFPVADLVKLEDAE